MKYQQLAKDIISKVGGKNNVKSVVHCVTRLRFKLKDESKADTDALKGMDGVVTVMKSGGQYQVVIGNHVPDVYKAVVEEGGFQSEGQLEEEGDKGSLFDRFIDVIASIFTPILGVLAATGMIKGFNALFLAMGILEESSGTYQVLNVVGDSLFYYLPVFLGYTAMKKFGGTPFVGIAIGASLVYPSLTTISGGEPLYTLFGGTMFESPVYLTFLGVPVILMSYASSVIPVILAALFASKLEKGLRKIIPDVVKTFLVPFGTLLVTVPLTLIVIGPIATWASQLLGQGSVWIFELSPAVAGVFIGGLWQVFVMFGLHWGLVPVAINNLAVLGSDPVLAMMFAASFAQIGAVLGVWLKTRQQAIKTLSLPAFISGIFGVTEPAIYGITLPKKRPFIISCIAGGVGGGIMGFFGSQVFMIGGLGIFGIPTFIGPEGVDGGFYAMIAAVLIAFALGFALTYLFGVGNDAVSEDEETVNAPMKTEMDVKQPVSGSAIVSPFKGKVRALTSIEDEAFATEALGKGIAIVPEEGKLFAPVSGTVTALFPTKHAVGITSDSGIEILIHIGMDTVQLQGEHFTSHIQKGDQVESGDLLIEFNVDEITKAGFSLSTPVIVTNHEAYQLMTTQESAVKPGDVLITFSSLGKVSNG